MIAISYRREDTVAVAGRLYDRLEAKFGKQNVFMDFDSIRPGFDFRDQIRETLKGSAAVIAVIGPQWLGERADGSRRIDDPTDFVRFELACALESGIPVIPVLVDNTPMPKPETLPSDIASLAFRHALPLDSGLDFRNHADRLISAVMPRSGAGQKVFGRYTLDRILGRGGMGSVWSARDEQLDTLVALKMLPETLCHDRASLSALKRETKLGLNLAHPNIVRIYNFQQDEYAAAIAMEYVDGPTISEVQQSKEQQVFDPPELTALIEALCDALHYAHTRRKIVHRDLKPRNLMLTSDGELKIADFGISRNISESMIMLTGAGSTGTPPYISPQQWDGDPPTPLDDIYSVGATLYELLTGKPPLMGIIDSEQVHHKVPPPIWQRRIDLGITGAQPIPASWEEAIAACLAKDPKDRPQTIHELRSRLLDAPAAGAPIIDTTIPKDVDLTPGPALPTVPQNSALAASPEDTVSMAEARAEVDLEDTAAALPQSIVDDVAPPPAVQREEHVSLAELSPPVAQEPPLKADLKHTAAALPESIIDDVAPPPPVKRKRKRVSVRWPKHPVAQEPPEADQAPHSDIATSLDEVQTPPSEAPMISDAEVPVPISSQVRQDIAEIAPALGHAPDAQSAAEALLSVETPGIVESEDEASPMVASADDISMPVLPPPSPTAASPLPSVEQSAAILESGYPSSTTASTTVGEPSPSWWREIPRWWREAPAWWREIQIPRWCRQIPRLWREMPRWLWPSAGAAAVLISVLFLLWSRPHRVEQSVSSHKEQSASAHPLRQPDDGSRSQLGQTAAPASVVQGSASPQPAPLADTSAQSPSPGPTQSAPASASNELLMPGTPAPSPPVASEMPTPPAGPSVDMTTESVSPAAPVPAPTSVGKHASAAADASSSTTKAESNSRAPQKPSKRPSHKTIRAAQTPAAKMPAASVAPSPGRAKASVRRTPPPQPFDGVPGN